MITEQDHGGTTIGSPAACRFGKIRPLSRNHRQPLSLLNPSRGSTGFYQSPKLAAWRQGTGQTFLSERIDSLAGVEDGQGWRVDWFGMRGVQRAFGRAISRRRPASLTAAHPRPTEGSKADRFIGLMYNGEVRSVLLGRWWFSHNHVYLGSKQDGQRS
jgi:hypothetical protein